MLKVQITLYQEEFRYALGELSRAVKDFEREQSNRTRTLDYFNRKEELQEALRFAQSQRHYFISHAENELLEPAIKKEGQLLAGESTYQWPEGGRRSGR